jgi:hypothetical protein
MDDKYGWRPSMDDTDITIGRVHIFFHPSWREVETETVGPYGELVSFKTFPTLVEAVAYAQADEEEQCTLIPSTSASAM